MVVHGRAWTCMVGEVDVHVRVWTFVWPHLVQRTEGSAWRRLKTCAKEYPLEKIAGQFHPIWGAGQQRWVGADRRGAVESPPTNETCVGTVVTVTATVATATVIVVAITLTVVTITVTVVTVHEELGFRAIGGALFRSRDAPQDARIWGHSAGALPPRDTYFGAAIKSKFMQIWKVYLL
eukprot:354571-Chlamydomonas_euryale.AAC.3